MYSATTHSIKVSVEPYFLEQESDFQKSQYFWAYKVVIENLGEKTVQLRTRYWQITDGLGRVEEVRGPGVVGEEPILNPGDTYEYTSGCPLKTSSGVMVGKYTMETEDGDHFEAEIPAFSLDVPDRSVTLN